MAFNLLFTRRRWLIVTLVIASIVLVLVAISMFTTQAPEQTQPKAPGSTTFPKNYPVGVWSWKTPDTYTQQAMEAQATKLAKDHISTVYTDISSYADYFEITDATEKQVKIDTLTASLKQFIRIFRQNNIEVQALAGNSDWGNPDYWHLPEAILAYVSTYNINAAPAERLAGLQFDIEYYNDETFEEDKTTNITQYLDITHELITKQLQTGSDFPLGFTLPYWFDNENGNAPKVKYGSTRKTPMQHLADQLNILPNGYITVMSYRDKATGKDGVIAHAQQEVDYASSKNNTKVYIGLETTDVQPKKITFYNQPKTTLTTAATQIAQAFDNKRAFSGFTINDSDGFLNL